jgi:hypothetical protein
MFSQTLALQTALLLRQEAPLAIAAFSCMSFLPCHRRYLSQQLRIALTFLRLESNAKPETAGFKIPQIQYKDFLLLTLTSPRSKLWNGRIKYSVSWHD